MKHRQNDFNKHDLVTVVTIVTFIFIINNC